MTANDNGGIRSGDDPVLDRDPHWQQVAQQLYDPDRDGGLTTTIVFAIADADGVAPREVTSPRLYDVVDVAGIEQAFFGSGMDERRGGTGSVEFRYREYLVKVRSDGWTQVYEATESEHA